MAGRYRGELRFKALLYGLYQRIVLLLIPELSPFLSGCFQILRIALGGLGEFVPPVPGTAGYDLCRGMG